MGVRLTISAWRPRLFWSGMAVCLALMLAPLAFAQQNGNIVVLKPAATSGGIKRLAIVIGNGAYQNVQELRNPKNDADAVASKLQRIGYSVVYAHDLDRKGMNEAVDTFLAMVEPGSEALVYYSGHGVDLNGANYLLPIDIPALDPDQERMLRVEGINATDLVLDLQAKSARVNIVILDACRDNPFRVASAAGLTRSLGATRGLAAIEPPRGTFIMFSAGVGEQALDSLGSNDKDPNGLFTRKLLALMDQDGLEIHSLFLQLRAQVQQAALTVGGHSQLPGYYDQLLGEFYFRPKSLEPSGQTVSETDQTVWAHIRESGDAAALQAFLQRYPDSFFAPDAAARLSALEERARAPSAAALAELNAKLDAEEAGRRHLEEELAKRRADNAAGDQTEALKGEVEKLILEIGRMKNQIAAAGGPGVNEAKKDEAASKADSAAIVKPVPSVVATATPTPASTPNVVATAQPNQQKPLESANAPPAPTPAPTPIAVAAIEPAQAKPSPPAGLAATPPPAPTPTVAALETVDMPQVRAELRRIGCYAGGDSDWSAPEMQLGVAKYAHYAKLESQPTAPTAALLEDLKRRGAGFCPPQCLAREILVDGRCVAKSCAPDQILNDSGVCASKPKARVAVNRVSPSAGAPAKRTPAGHCLVFNGNQYCE